MPVLHRSFFFVTASYLFLMSAISRDAEFTLKP